jgi:hypothetical protein
MASRVPAALGACGGVISVPFSSEGDNPSGVLQFITRTTCGSLRVCMFRMPRTLAMARASYRWGCGCVL